MNARSETNATDQARYWLEHVKAFGGRSRVLIVGNRLDQAMLNLDMAQLRSKYDNVEDFFPLSCTKAKGAYRSHAEAFKTAFCTQLKALETHQVKFTEQQFAVLQALRERTPHKAFLAEQEFAALCDAQNIGDEGIQNRTWLLDLFDKLGVIIHFKELAQRAVCSNAYVLNPRWLTYGIYTVMCNKQAQISKRDVVQLLRKEQVKDEQGNVLDYPEDKCAFILEAMRQFKLAYPLRDDPNTLIIPNLLPATEPPHQFDNNGALAFEFDFAVFLPRHLLPQLIVQRHQDIAIEKDSQWVWQTGVVFANAREQARALVTADYHERRIRLWVSGAGAREYLTILRGELWDMLEKIKIACKEWVILPRSAGINLRNAMTHDLQPEKASYMQLLGHAKNGAREFIADSGDKYDVAKVLGAFVSPANQSRELQQIHNHIYGDSPVVNNTQEQDMGSNFTTNVINSPVTGNVTTAKTIKDSFNAVSESTAVPELKAAFEKLLSAIETVQKTAPANLQRDVEDMAKGAQELIAEKAQAEPSPSRLLRHLNMVVEVAKSAGELGKTVMDAVDTVRPMLGL